MRDELCRSLVRRAAHANMVFLTGDLGFMALEPLRDALGQRFVNAGVAEQNMITVAAALASEGLDVWTYTIAPFCYARAFEQIRNDVCLHNLPVKLLGNGGGYGYGVMGPTHHALEDYGVLLTLDAMKVFVPAFKSDVDAALERACDLARPTYVRLGRCELPSGVSPPAYAPWRKILDGESVVVIAVGPLAGVALGALHDLDATDRPELWALVELPLTDDPPPPELQFALKRASRVIVIEEHVVHGSVGQSLALWCVENGIALRSFTHLAARNHNSGTYGSQAFLRNRSGLDAGSIRREVLGL